MPTSLRFLATTAGLTMAVVGLSALAGCSSDSRPAAESAPATTTATTPAASTAPALPSTSTGPATPTGAITNPTTGTAAAAHPSGTAAPPTRSTADPCPVTVTTLLNALRDSPEFYQRAAKPAALQDAACANGYAIAGTVYDGQHQTTQIVFSFDAAASHWHPLNLGSADFCEGFVPDDVAAKLSACG
ncbi:hypothetical protein [Dactylosporangium sp. NPDC048998]|uniref:hypothetical protein n=1 Tax=Dactylosporangium sp. NPDC048998 TaxID=3363976 RepID=UPI00371D5435